MSFLLDKLQETISTIGNQETIKNADRVSFKYLSGPILHIKFMPGLLTDEIFKHFIETYRHIFDDKTEKFVFLFDLRDIHASSFKIEWVIEFISVLVSLREQTAVFVKGTAIYLPDKSDSIVEILKMFFNLYKTVRPHFASYNESEILDFVEKCLFS